VTALEVVGSGLASFLTVLRGVEEVQKRRKKDASPESGATAALTTRLGRLEQDVARLFDRDPPPDLSERVTRLEDDVRENATAAALRHDRVLETLGKLRGMLDALLRGGSIHDD